jgi:hypothetical protein
MRCSEEMQVVMSFNTKYAQHESGQCQTRADSPTIAKPHEQPKHGGVKQTWNWAQYREFGYWNSLIHTRFANNKLDPHLTHKMHLNIS